MQSRLDFDYEDNFFSPGTSLTPEKNSLSSIEYPQGRSMRFCRCTYTHSNNVSSAERKALQTREDWGYGSAPQNILKFSVFPKDISLN